MARLSKDQLEYVRNRIQETTKKLLAALKDQFLIPFDKLSAEQRSEVINVEANRPPYQSGGNIELRPGVQVTANTLAVDVVVVSGGAEVFRDEPAYRAAVKCVRDQSSRLIEELILGDAKDALDGLREFEAFEPLSHLNQIDGSGVQLTPCKVTPIPE